MEKARSRPYLAQARLQDESPRGIDIDTTRSVPNPFLITARSLARFPRRLVPPLGRWLDRSLRQAIEDWRTRSGKFLFFCGANPDYESFPGLSMTARCARIGNADLLAWFCSAGIDPNGLGSDLWSPLHHAAAKGRQGAIEVLARAGADLAAQDHLGRSPLMLACKENQVLAVLALCSLNARVDQTDSRSETPLLLCARLGFDSCARALLSHGARVDAIERRGFQAIHLAASGGHDALCRDLMEFGADPCALGPWGKNPAGLARAENHVSTLALLERAALGRDIDDAPRSGPARL